ncbi:hypothetical protein D3C87_1518530 [compost metagenome]
MPFGQVPFQQRDQVASGDGGVFVGDFARSLGVGIAVQLFEQRKPSINLSITHNIRPELDPEDDVS